MGWWEAAKPWLDPPITSISLLLNALTIIALVLEHRRASRLAEIAEEAHRALMEAHGWAKAERQILADRLAWCEERRKWCREHPDQTWLVPEERRAWARWGHEQKPSFFELTEYANGETEVWLPDPNSPIPFV